MSIRYEYVTPGAFVEYVAETDLSVENPDPGQQVLVLWYDEAVVIPGTPGEVADLIDRIAAAVGLTHDTRSRASRKHRRSTGRYLFHAAGYSVERLSSTKS